MSHSPFENIESAQLYVRLLGEVLEEARATVQHDSRRLAGTAGTSRRLDALRLVEYKLTQLHGHLVASGRILNDLRRLERLLLGETDDAVVETYSRPYPSTPAPFGVLRTRVGLPVC